MIHIKDAFLVARNEKLTQTYLDRRGNLLTHVRAFQVALAVKNLTANAGDTGEAGLIPGSE